MSPARGRARVVAAWAAASLVFLLLAAPGVERPGLYYDEAFLGQQARDFLEPTRRGAHPASTREVEIAGRPFPLRNAVYLGALKSQLLIPVFAAFGPSVPALRLGTLAVALAGLLACLLFAERALGPGPALVGGALAVLDPAFVFLALSEWGPFTTLLLCRGLALWLLFEAWRRDSPGRAAAGGLALGLGVYTRADFAVVAAAAGAALLLVRPGVLRALLGPRRRLLAAGGAAALLGAAPMLLSAGDLLRTTSSPAIGARGGLDEKARVLGSLLDGSHFHRLMRAGGRFGEMFEERAPAGAFAAGALLAALVIVGGAAADRRRGRPPGADVFCLAAWLLATGGTLLLPGAVRAHHVWNAFPLLHLAVGAAAVRAWRESGGGALGAAARGGVALAVAAVLFGDAGQIARTRVLVDATGGRGWWSDATREVAEALDAEPGARGVSLDWGLHEPLLFQTQRARLVEPIWEIREAARASGRWRFDGAPRDVYLVHERDYDLFGYGPPFLAAARSLAEAEPDAVAIREHRDREGAPVLHSVRFARPHEVTWRGAFRIRLRPAGDPGAVPGAPPPPPPAGGSPPR